MAVTKDPRQLRVLGGAALLVGAVEVLLCFAGPIAFMRKSGLMLFPVFSSGLGTRDTMMEAALLGLARPEGGDGSHC